MAVNCPSPEPLEKLLLEKLNPNNGLIEKLPALHEGWCEIIEFLPFTSPPDASATRSDHLLQEWVEILEMIDDDLDTLLRLPHHQFWSHAVYDKTLRQFLDSYLQHTLRPYEEPWSIPTSAQETLRNVHKNVFLTMLRLSTHEESSEHFFSPTGFGDLLYTHLIFTIPSILDLCCIYGNSNGSLVSTMVQNIFDKQPKYKEDLKICGDDVNNLLDTVTKKVIPEDHSSSLKLDAAEDIDPEELSDLILYVADAMHTIASFLLIYPPGAAILWSSGLAIKLVAFYESIITQLQSWWKKSHHSSMKRPVYVKERLRRCKKFLVSVVLSLLLNCVDKKEVLAVAGDVIDQVMSCLTVMASGKNFLKEFEKHFNLAECLDGLEQLLPALDKTRVQYIFSAVQGKPAVAANLACSSVTGTVSSSSPEILRASARHEDEAVDQIQKILPHLGKGFVELCLQEYGGDSEKVIDHILEESLPTHLQLVDTSAEEFSQEVVQTCSQPVQSHFHTPASANNDDQTPDLVPKWDMGKGVVKLCLQEYGGDSEKVIDHNLEGSTEELSQEVVQTCSQPVQSHFHTPASANNDDQTLDEQRKGVYDHDEFDVFHRGEKTDLVPEWDIYDDEYDDTYDSLQFGAEIRRPPDEMFSVKRLDEKGLYSTDHGRRSSSEEEEDKVEAVPLRSGFSSDFPKSGHSRGNHATKDADIDRIMEAAKHWESSHPQFGLLGVAQQEHIPTRRDGRRVWSDSRRATETGLPSQDEHHDKVSAPCARKGGKQQWRDERKMATEDKEIKKEERVGCRRDDGRRSREGRKSYHTRETAPSDERCSHHLKEKHKASHANHNRKKMAGKKQSRALGGYW